MMSQVRGRTGGYATRGFSFFELLIVFAIIGILALVIASGFRNFVHHERLETAAHDLYTMLADARSATLASEYGEQFGVRVEPDRIIRFRGAAYSPSSASNQVQPLAGITVTSSLSGGPEIVFEKQTGRTTNSGTIQLTNQTTLASITLTVYASGIVSIP